MLSGQQKFCFVLGLVNSNKKRDLPKRGYRQLRLKECSGIRSRAFHYFRFWGNHMKTKSQQQLMSIGVTAIALMLCSTVLGADRSTGRDLNSEAADIEELKLDSPITAKGVIRA